MQGQIRGVCSPTLLQPASGLRLKTTVQLSAKTGRVALQCKAVAYDEPALAVKKANDTQVANSSDHSDADKLSKEEERRKKISAANKGKTPWNKGLHYTDGTTLFELVAQHLGCISDTCIRGGWIVNKSHLGFQLDCHVLTAAAYDSLQRCVQESLGPHSWPCSGQRCVLR